VLVTGTISLAIGVGAFALWGLTRVPSISSQLPPEAATVRVTLLFPNRNTSWPLNSFVPLVASAEAGQPIASLELFVNGNLLDKKAMSPGWSFPHYTNLWSWQPGSQGRFTIIVRATDRAGNSALSNPLDITATEATGTRSPIAVESGETLAALAAEHQVSPDDLLQANPSLPPTTSFDAVLEPGSLIFIPNPPVPVLEPVTLDPEGLLPNGKLPGGNLPGQEPPEGTSPGGESGGPSQLVQASGALSNLSFLTQGALGEEPTSAPEAPKIVSADFSKCIVTLIWNDYAMQEGSLKYPWGFFIYRSKGGQDLERIATVNGKETAVDFRFEDPNQAGQVTYAVSAFSAAGETMSAPITLLVAGPDCAPEAPSGRTSLNAPYLDGGDLVLPSAMDVAYLYVQINGSAGVRVPDGNRTFLPGSGQRFNLTGYLDSIVEQVQAPDLEIDMEVWGWAGGALEFVGKVHTTVNRTVLLACSQEGQGACSTGGAPWTGAVTVRTDKPIADQVFEFRWETTGLIKATDLVQQISADAYTGPGVRDTHGIISSYEMPADEEWFGAVGNGSEGTFSLELALLYPPQPDTSECAYGGWGASYAGTKNNYSCDWFADSYPNGTPFTLHVRTIPLHNGSSSTAPSNVVLMHYNTPPLPSNAPALASEHPSIYDVEILRDSYRAPNFESTFDRWGCVVIDEDPTGNFSVGQVVCPGIIAKQAQQACEGFSIDCLWELMKGFSKSVAELADFVIYGINLSKAAYASVIIDIIPYCSDYDLCKDAVVTGVNYGVSALTGLPPSIPSFDQLASDSIRTWALSEVGGIEIPGVDFLCDADCKKQIADELIPQIKMAASLHSQPACGDILATRAHGQEPACLDPRIVVHPAWGSGYYPAFVAVKITRRTTPESMAVTQADSGAYRLDLGILGENFARKGFYGDNCVYRDNLTAADLVGPPPEYTVELDELGKYNYTAFTDDREEGHLFAPNRVPVPWLEPGESAVIPFTLQSSSSDSASPKWWQGSCTRDVRLQYLYFRGLTHMQATEACFSSGSSVEWVPCAGGGSDAWNFDNPQVIGGLTQGDASYPENTVISTPP
jgi:LysM repeat protein